MKAASDPRPVPTREFSALREVVRTRGILEEVILSLGLAIQISAGASSDAGLTASLERIRSQLEDAQADLWDLAR